MTQDEFIKNFLESINKAGLFEESKTNWKYQERVSEGG